MKQVLTWPCTLVVDQWIVHKSANDPYVNHDNIHFALILLEVFASPVDLYLMYPLSPLSGAVLNFKWLHEFLILFSLRVEGLIVTLSWRTARKAVFLCFQCVLLLSMYWFVSWTATSFWKLRSDCCFWFFLTSGYQHTLTVRIRHIVNMKWLPLFLSRKGSF